MNADIHTQLTLKNHRLVQEDYDFFWRLHDFMDCSKEVEARNYHRILTHHMFFVKRVVIPVFGSLYKSHLGKNINIKDCMESDHILADYKNKFIPNLYDYSDLILVNSETDAALSDIHTLRDAFKDFFKENQNILEFLDSPLYLTGNKLSLLITWNSWYVGKIIPLIFKTKMPFTGIEPAKLFNNLKPVKWINNGDENLPRLQNNRSAPLTSKSELID